MMMDKTERNKGGVLSGIVDASRRANTNQEDDHNPHCRLQFANE